jgi:hypothetical protein
MATSAEVLKVSTQTLREDADVWRRQVAPMTESVGLLDAAEFEGWLDHTLYYPYMGSYATITAFVRARCDEATRAFPGIARALDDAAGMYEQVTRTLEARRP